MEKQPFTNSVRLEVWGDYACFSRPEMKVERVSYDVMTPSAARGILEAIYWHPGIKWIVDSIRVCAPIQFVAVRRNEVSEKANSRAARAVMESGKGEIYLNTRECAVQRSSIILKDVRYVIEAHFELTDKMNPSDNVYKFSSMIQRRIEKGQFYHKPCFGCREFPVNFQKCEKIPECPDSLKGEKDLGWMLYDMDYTDPENITPRFYRAVMKDGLITLPPYKEAMGK